MRARLTVRSDQEVLSWLVDNDWLTYVAVAILSTEPTSMEEFFDALRRYQPNHKWDEVAEPATLDQADQDADEWCFICLVSQTVVVGGDDMTPPERGGIYDADNERQANGFPYVWIEAPSYWDFSKAAGDWRSRLAARMETTAPRRRLDTRPVLLGRPMAEFVSRQIREQAVDDLNPNQRYERIKSIHADWLMQPLPQLDGQTPREILLRDREQIDREMENRRTQWSEQGFAPHPISREATAFKFGGYGIVQIVLYFNLMRKVLDDAWHRAINSDASFEQFVQQTQAFCLHCLDECSDVEGGAKTVRAEMDCERQRIPLTTNVDTLDCDCPICQASADGTFGHQPSFAMFDPFQLEMEDDFAFSVMTSREEWEFERDLVESDSDEEDLDDEDLHDEEDELDAEISAMFEAAAKSKRFDQHESIQQDSIQQDSIWKSSYVDWDALGATGKSGGVAKVMVGFPLAELVSELKAKDETSADIETLNSSYRQFCQAQDAVAERSAAEKLRSQLELVAVKHGDLISRSADLQSRLDELMRVRS